MTVVGICHRVKSCAPPRAAGDAGEKIGENPRFAEHPPNAIGRMKKNLRAPLRRVGVHADLWSPTDVGLGADAPRDLSVRVSVCAPSGRRDRTHAQPGRPSAARRSTSRPAPVQSSRATISRKPPAAKLAISAPGRGPSPFSRRQAMQRNALERDQRQREVEKASRAPRRSPAPEIGGAAERRVELDNPPVEPRRERDPRQIGRQQAPPPPRERRGK